MAIPNEILTGRVRRLQALCADAEETLQALRQSLALAEQELSDEEWPEGEVALQCEVHTQEDADRVQKFAPELPPRSYKFIPKPKVA